MKRAAQLGVGVVLIASLTACSNEPITVPRCDTLICVSPAEKVCVDGKGNMTFTVSAAEVNGPIASYKIVIKKEGVEQGRDTIAVGPNIPNRPHKVISDKPASATIESDKGEVATLNLDPAKLCLAVSTSQTA